MTEVPAQSLTSASTADVQSREELVAEVRLLHRQFFGGPVPAEVEDRYVEANRQVLAGIDPSRVAALSRLRQSGCDAEAVECALRLRGRAHPLTTKVQILFYLVEVRSAYYDRFVDEAPGRWKAARALLAAVARTAWKFVKGNWQIARYRLA